MEKSIRLQDGATRIFLNTKGILDKEDISPNMRAFLEYVEGTVSDNTFVKKIAEEIVTVKSSKKWRVEYMNQVVRDQLNIEAGEIKGKIENQINLIRKNISKNLSITNIALFMDEDISYVEGIVTLMQAHPEETNEELVKRLL